MVPGLEKFNEQANKTMTFAILTLLVSVAGPAFGGPEGRPIDSAHSTMTVFVYKPEFLSVLAHNHEIGAPIEWGEVKDSESASVEQRVHSK